MMNKNVISFAVVALIVVSVLFVFNDPNEQAADSVDEGKLEKLTEENERLKDEVAQLKEEASSIKPMVYQDFLDAKKTVELFAEIDELEVAKSLLTDNITIIEQSSSFSINVNKENGSTTMREWIPTSDLELISISKMEDQIILFYNADWGDLVFTLVKEDGWKIKDIK
ncbi:bZIP transcription factor [Bacillus shivajii]|uniref:bZIP transcription factor n=1 Tax=Bacillus shivajii TaxID=1983719 RepID=UPI001CFA1775|nr:bZIP transcription factor [Bacillus shivajii]UCZ53502.1 bZIP transcription factor [Bacillus shivajii]